MSVTLASTLDVFIELGALVLQGRQAMFDQRVRCRVLVRRVYARMWRLDRLQQRGCLPELVALQEFYPQAEYHELVGVARDEIRRIHLAAAIDEDTFFEDFHKVSSRVCEGIFRLSRLERGLRHLLISRPSPATPAAVRAFTPKRREVK